MNKRIEISISVELYWKLEEERVQRRYDNLSILIEEVCRKIFNMSKEPEYPSLSEEIIDECILDEFPNAKGEKYRDIRSIVVLMIKSGFTRREAVKERAKEKRVYQETVQSNITRGFGINTDELDKKLDKIIKCINTKINY